MSSRPANPSPAPRRLRGLLAAAALIASALAGVGVIVASPAEACVFGSCGDSTTTISSIQRPSLDPNDRHYGQYLRFFVSVSDNSLVGNHVPTGTVDYFDGAAVTPFATGTLAGNATADYQADTFVDYAGLPAGDHTIRAVYVPAGPNDFNPSSGTKALNIPSASTNTTLSQSPASAVIGTPVTFTATVHDAGGIDLAGGAHLPTGTVEFFSGLNSLGAAVSLSGGSASFTTSALTGGNHTISAQYSGDDGYALKIFTLAEPHVVTAGTTTSVLTQSNGTNPTVYGEPFTLTDTVTADAPATGVPTGSVQFYDGTTAIIGMNLTGGVASSPDAFLLPGAHSLKAIYAGDVTNFNGSTSNVLAHTVNRASTTTALTSPTANPTTLGQPVTLNATVAVSAPGTGTPTGSVQFKDGTTNLGAPVPLSGLNASLTTSTLGGGVHSVTAVYAGDTNFNTSTSSALSRTITCDVVVNGTVNGTYNVPATGTTCITNANITGGVNIPGGAKVSIVGATIGGSLMATGATGTIVVCGSSMSTITINNAAGAVTVGDPYTAGCAGNTIRGNATLASNHGGVRINGNRVSGSLNVSGTTGGATVIGGNTVGGSLQCSGNVPAPTNETHPNSPGGRGGQCATPPNF